MMIPLHHNNINLVKNLRSPDKTTASLGDEYKLFGYRKLDLRVWKLALSAELVIEFPIFLSSINWDLIPNYEASQLYHENVESFQM